MSPQLQRILAFGRRYWPAQRFFGPDVEAGLPGQTCMIESVALAKETVVVAANQVGKDYTAAFVSLSFFLMPQLYFPESYVLGIERSREQHFQRTGERLPDHLVHTVRVMTTSVKDDHLDNLWGEIGRLVTTSKVPLLAPRGPLLKTSHEIRLARETVETGSDPLNYLKGRVAKQGESMAGWHAAYTLFVADEASGLWDEVYQHAQGCAKKMLFFGNPWPSPFFEGLVKTGDIAA